MESVAIVPKGASSMFCSSAVTNPRPLMMVKVMSILTLESILQITKSGFKTWNPEICFPISPAFS